MGLFSDLFGAGTTPGTTSPGGLSTPEYTRHTTAPEPMTIPGNGTAPLLVRQAQADGRRPCWARGRKAMFHRWVDAAHPVPPRGAEINEKTRYYQFRSTTALVEFEDGTCARVYPNEIQFADTGGFDEYAWLPMTEGGTDDGAE